MLFCNGNTAIIDLSKVQFVISEKTNVIFHFISGSTFTLSTDSVHLTKKIINKISNLDWNRDGSVYLNDI